LTGLAAELISTHMFVSTPPTGKFFTSVVFHIMKISPTGNVKIINLLAEIRALKEMQGI
jgi:hypothetical protein